VRGDEDSAVGGSRLGTVRHNRMGKVEDLPTTTSHRLNFGAVAVGLGDDDDHRYPRPVQEPAELALRAPQSLRLIRFVRFAENACRVGLNAQPSAVRALLELPACKLRLHICDLGLILDDFQALAVGEPHRKGSPPFNAWRLRRPFANRADLGAEDGLDQRRFADTGRAGNQDPDPTWTLSEKNARCSNAIGRVCRLFARHLRLA